MNEKEKNFDDEVANLYGERYGCGHKYADYDLLDTDPNKISRSCSINRWMEPFGKRCYNVVCSACSTQITMAYANGTQFGSITACFDCMEPPFI